MGLLRLVFCLVGTCAVVSLASEEAYEIASLALPSQAPSPTWLDSIPIPGTPHALAPTTSLNDLPTDDVKKSQQDYNYVNYVTNIENFLHSYLRSMSVKIHLIEGHTGFQVEKGSWLSNLYSLSDVTHVCEIGYNAGHSALNALLHQGMMVTSFDIGEVSCCCCCCCCRRRRRGERLVKLCSRTNNTASN